jgi:hypothetical protein
MELAELRETTAGSDQLKADVVELRKSTDRCSLAQTMHSTELHLAQNTLTQNTLLEEVARLGSRTEQLDEAQASGRFVVSEQISQVSELHNADNVLICQLSSEMVELKRKLDSAKVAPALATEQETAESLGLDKLRKEVVELTRSNETVDHRFSLAQTTHTTELDTLVEEVARLGSRTEQPPVCTYASDGLNGGLYVDTVSFETPEDRSFELAYTYTDVMVDVPTCTHASNCLKGGLDIDAASLEPHEGRIFAPACI